MSQAVADREALPLLLRFSAAAPGGKEPPKPALAPRPRAAPAKAPKRRRGYPEWLGYTPEIQRLLR